jgi:hydroxymethylpyrimidine/phosphomethylpyrimidine kinase
MLVEAEAMEIYERELFPIATLLTPNLDEAGKLIGEPIRYLEAMRKAGKQLQQKYAVSILLKGGHLVGAMQSICSLLATRSANFRRHLFVESRRTAPVALIRRQLPQLLPQVYPWKLPFAAQKNL